MTSPQLYDPGEENWPVKVHAACGGIYLRGYLNIDIMGELASERPDKGHYNLTDIRDYYARLDLTPERRRPNVVDAIGDMTALEADRVNKLVCIQALEHLTPLRALTALMDWHDALVPGGVLIVSVPDMVGTIEWAANGKHEFAIRHLRGSGRDAFNWHHSWWTRTSLNEMLTTAGFAVEWLDNFHDYPAIVARGRKV